MLALLLACTAAPDPSAESPRHEAHRFGFARSALPVLTRDRWPNGRDGDWLDLPTQLPDLEPLGGAVPPPGSESALSQIGAHIEDADLDFERGELLQQRLDEEDPSDVAKYGVALLTLDDAFGTETEPAVCEPLGVEFRFEEDGTEYEGGIELEPYFHIGGDPQPVWQTLSGGCADALLTLGGDVAGAEAQGDCSIYEMQQWFLDGSTCRDCVETGAGDFAQCVTGGDCPEETVAQNYIDGKDGTRTWYRTFNGADVACAPAWVTPYFLLARTTGDQALPTPFDHTSIGAFCLYFKNPETDDVESYCMLGVDPPNRTDALGEGGITHLSYVREAGATDTPHAGRMAYFARIDFSNGNFIRWMELSSLGGAGILSLPNVPYDLDGDGVLGPGDWGYDYPEAGVGLNPTALRPDGTDPSDPDQTLARDWLAADALKTATTINGIYVTYINHNVCTADGWSDPDAEGVSLCRERAAPEPGWLNDAENIWIDEERTATQPFPMVTLASTGLPDPAIPGGIAIHVAGSTSLSNPDWEGCTWPDSFSPDLVPVVADPFHPEGPFPLTAQTWRFDGHADRDFRVVLATNQLRGFCPEE
jgi:hypothetical protein